MADNFKMLLSSLNNARKNDDRKVNLFSNHEIKN
jgi:hypothetical protein